MFQDVDFCVPDLAGRELEMLVGVVLDEDVGMASDHADSGGPDASIGRPSIFLLKVSGQHWQRFFFDGGVGFWGEYDSEALEEELSMSSIDYASAYALGGRRVERVACGERDDIPGTTCLTIGLDGGTEFVVYILDPDDHDSDTGVRLVARAK